MPFPPEILSNSAPTGHTDSLAVDALKDIVTTLEALEGGEPSWRLYFAIGSAIGRARVALIQAGHPLEPMRRR
jgi:hypothetical protein